MKMYNALMLTLLAAIVCSCNTDIENIDLQKLYTYDDQYYQNLRDFKKSDHQISYAYYESWSPIEGAEGTKYPPSWGERIMGLPDSIDIVNLWMGIPTADTHPLAYEDMKYCQRVKGTKFVMHADASNYRHEFTVDGVDWDLNTDRSDEAFSAYGKWIVNTVLETELDGVDIDWEGWSGADLVKVVVAMAEYFGPKGSMPDMLLIVDFFASTPPSSLIPYCDYFISQSYSNQTGGIYHPSGFPYEKLVYCESFGVFYADGGKLMDYAAWQPSSGQKGGCGVFFLGRNYYSDSGIPYNEFRKAIQIMNPAIY